MSKSEPSSRALSNNITMSFQGIYVPVRLFSGINKSDGIERHQYLVVPELDEQGNPKVETVEIDGETKEVPVVKNIPVGNGQISKETKALLTDEEKQKIEKKVETEYGPVYLEDHEIEALFTLKQNTLDIFAFHPQALFARGEYVPKNLMFIEPQVHKVKGKNQPMEFSAKMLATLLKAMREEGVVAVGELTSRGVPKPVIMTPDGALWQVHHTNEVREQRPLPEVNLVDAEVAVMRQLVVNMSTDEVYDLTDQRSALIQDFADKKAKAGDFGRPEADTYVEQTPKEPEVNLLALLQASVESAKAKQAS